MPRSHKGFFRGLLLLGALIMFLSTILPTFSPYLFFAGLVPAWCGISLLIDERELERLRKERSDDSDGS